MTGKIFITGADRGLGFGICAGLLEQGWEIFAGQYLPEWPELSNLIDQYGGRLHLIPLDVGSEQSVQEAVARVSDLTDHIDILINNAGVQSLTSGRPIRETQDYAEMQRLYNINSLGSLRVVEAFLPLTDRGRDKRLCFVSSEAGSIGAAKRTSWFGYCMSKAALNMGVKILFNDLRPSGYTFRVYHPGWVRSYLRHEKNMAAKYEPEEAAANAIPIFLNDKEDEDRLALVDFEGKEWPW